MTAHVPPGYRKVETEADVRQLRDLADRAGDITRTWLCDRALKGDAVALSMVKEHVLREAPWAVVMNDQNGVSVTLYATAKDADRAAAETVLQMARGKTDLTEADTAFEQEDYKRVLVLVDLLAVDSSVTIETVQTEDRR